MADKLTVGRIEKLSDTPFTAKLSADYQVKAVSAKELIERGKAEGRAKILALVRRLPSPVTGVIAMDDYRYCKWCEKTWRGDDTHPPSLTCLWFLAHQEPEKEQG